MVKYIFKLHLFIFRKSHNPEDCILCNKKLNKPTKEGNQSDVCTCPNVVTCEECKTDNEINSTEGLTYIG